MRSHFILLIVAISGFLWVVLGAATGHQPMPEPAATYFEKAQRYQIVHTLALFSLYFIGSSVGNLQLSTAVAWVFGMLCFSGSLYIMALTGAQAVRFIVPIGGISFLIGWALLGVIAWSQMSLTRL